MSLGYTAWEREECSCIYTVDGLGDTVALGVVGGDIGKEMEGEEKQEG